MAIYNEILTPRYARMLQKLFGIKGVVPAKQLSGEMIAVIPFFNGVENRYLEGWGRFWGTIAVSAVAAQTAGGQVRNPVGSNIIAVLESIRLTEGGAATVAIHFSQAVNSVDMTTLSNFFRMDARGNQAPVSIISGGNNFADLGGGANTVRISVVNPTDTEFISFEDQEVTLLPGDTLRINCATVNTAINVNLVWRERFLEEPERF